MSRPGTRLEVRELHDMDECSSASALFNAVWAKSADDPLIAPSTLRALAHAGNYLAGAWGDSGMVGAIVGFLGLHQGELQLHSHILGVLPETQGLNVGFVLKQHQRAWALERGIHTVVWTFDPLVRRNAYFNIAKLGASVVAYYPDFYGPMHDAFNEGDETDRAFVVWELDSPRATAASTGRLAEPDLGDGEAVLEEGLEGGPVVHDASGPLVLAWIPEDLAVLRERNAALARAWRLALRETLIGALAAGYAVAGMTRSGWYVLRR